MRIRFQADNDLKRIIVDATIRRGPSIDFQNPHAAGLDGLADELVLGRAGEQGRILVSHDKRTMPIRLAEFIRQGGTSPDVTRDSPEPASSKRCGHVDPYLGGQPD